MPPVPVVPPLAGVPPVPVEPPVAWLPPVAVVPPVLEVVPPVPNGPTPPDELQPKSRAPASSAEPTCHLPRCDMKVSLRRAFGLSPADPVSAIGRPALAPKRNGRSRCGEPAVFQVRAGARQLAGKAWMLNFWFAWLLQSQISI